MHRSHSATECRYGSRFSSWPRSAQPGEDALVGLGLGQAGELAGRVVHAPVGADHRQLVEAVVAADLVVERVVTGRDLQRARAEVALDPLVGDHRHAALDERDDDLAADESRYRSSSGWTATATSARIVAGRTVAIVT